MNRTPMQQAGIAAEAINAVNQGTRAALNREPDADVNKVPHLYDITASVLLLAQRLQLTPGDLKNLTEQWHAEGRLATERALNTEKQVAEFSEKMSEAQRLARELWLTLSDGAETLATIGSVDKVPEPR